MATRIEVDYNSRDDAGLIPALLEDASGHLHVGDTIETYDDAGYRCLAVVESVVGERAAMNPLWQTFATPEQASAWIERASPRLLPEWTNRLTVYVSVMSVPLSTGTPPSTEPSVRNAPHAIPA